MSHPIFWPSRLQWTSIGESPHFILLIHHTDKEREWAYDRQCKIWHPDKALDEARSHGWTVVAMKKDWSQVFSYQAP